MEGIVKLLAFCFYLLLITAISTSADTINTIQSIRDADAIVSAGGSFKLGFFSPDNSATKYLGIWYNKIADPTVVWVANREIAINDSSGVLRVSDQGILVLVNGNGSIIWSSNSTRPSRKPIAQLLDSGNLIVKNEGDDNPENYLWQSFDYPADTLLPGMKLGWNRATGFSRYISSWKTPNDPARGNFTSGIDPGGYPELIVREGSTLHFRAGSWNGLQFTGTPGLRPNSIYTYEFVINEKEWYYIYQLLSSSLLSRMVINQNGILQQFTWNERTKNWGIYLQLENDDCDRYALCGAYGSCNLSNSPKCSCLTGFEPKVPKEWGTADWSSGCVRKTALNCSADGFRKYTPGKLPETRNSWFDKSMSLAECRITCMKNCSCTAYANLDIRGGGRGCLLWFSGLIDMRDFGDNGQDIYIRMAASEIALDEDMKTKSKSNKMRIILSSVLPAAVLILGLIILLRVWKKKKQQKHRIKTGMVERNANDNTDTEDLELPLFDFATIASATNDFSINNKLGEGGFGPVFRGMLKDGQEIAVKRLSKDSNQGLNEFKNEVIHIAKLQHRNLVKLLGCCIQSDEKMLIYEFMPNKSLDFFIFDRRQSKILDWPKRHHIINGIARGLLYLHQDSRLRIIHRDLKAGNILLDYEMNPKISDFGLARSFGGNETQANTSKVVGTYGYMSPEYAIDGVYSVKSDVFSFGVIMLEIVSGKRNRGFTHEDHHLNLLGHAWRLHKEGRSIELIDPSLRGSCNLSEVLRSIHIGLLCVQRSLKHRPSMSAVVLMLCGDDSLPEPQLPGFFAERDLFEGSSSSNPQSSSSANFLTVTLVEAR
ncbi:hypothetical protein JCGZ_00736 [Jatropha curcas]|uniref:Receptor-like serine/threonine-protein kinase n=1 Tax=Jatropha curcas TaxID=180498 RepID=A0A067L4F6_JATCU|nr:G-type lectin S-receptor-like serine/threonine-protein kinase At4g27290 [Jatropha curcas]KDP38979.1 hypothetical protein JCGZ_00736 [Jatropha curcas]